MNTNEHLPRNTGEQVSQPTYADKAVDLVYLADNRNAAQRMVLMQEFVADVYADAEKGDITNGKEGESAYVYTTERMTAQLERMVGLLNEPKDEEDPLLSVPKANGLRSAFNTLLTHASTGEVLMKTLEQRLHPVKSLEMGEVNEVIAPETARDIGEHALESAGVEAPQSPEQRLAELIKDVSENDRMELRSYASSHESMVEARRSGQGENAQYFEQQKGQAQRAMSPTAFAIKGQYLSLYLAA